MDLTVNISKTICRICFNKVDDQNHTSFNNKIEFRDILHKITSCFQITVDFEKYLPCALCKKCIKELNCANNFRTKCLTIDERYKTYCEYLPQKIVNTTVITEDDIDDGDDNSISVKVEEYTTKNEDNNLNNTQVEKSASNNTFMCDKCNKVLKTKQSLLRHIVSMHEKKRVGNVTGSGSNRRHHCTYCSYSTPHSQTLVNHVRRHTNERPYKCDCGKTFTQASALTAHSKTHSNTVFFTCHKCGKQFKHTFLLMRHLRVTHNDGAFKCNICNKVLKSKSNLEIHIKRHNKVFSYSCEVCNRSFVTPSELKNHKIKHSKEKKIICSICDYSTKNKKNIAVHMKIHEGNKKFSCNYCTKAFLTNTCLRKHIRVHTKEKQYPCTNCSQRFAYSSSLNRHMFQMHGMKYKWGEIKFKESRMQSVTV